MNIFRKRTLADYEAAALSTGLKKSLKSIDIAAIGIGCVVGTGIFVATGQGALVAGPGITVSFIIGGIVSALCALTYAELATMFPVSGTAYAYSFVAFGEIVAWIIGWDLILAYLINSAAVASGWSGTVQGLLNSYGVHLPKAISATPMNGGILDLPAVLITLLITGILYIGVSESAKVNNTIVIIKLFVICLFIFLGATHINLQNYHPYLPYGFKGVMTGTAVIFFAYTGFDAISTSAEECQNPGRDLPIGLAICMGTVTLLYLTVSVTLTGIIPFSTIDPTNAIPGALSTIGIRWGSSLVATGAIIGMVSALLVTVYGQIRIFMVMGRDGLLPKSFGKVNKFSAPSVCTIVTGLATAISAGFLPLDFLINLCSIGTLFLFMVVSVAIIALRKSMPNIERKFKCPWVPTLPIISILGCAYIMLGFDFATWKNFIIYIAVGIGVYFVYARRGSTLNEKKTTSL